LREPLLHFLLVGAVLFGFSAWNNRASHPDIKQIILTQGDLEQMIIAMRAQGLPEPGPGQMRHLIDARVREEVLSREAIAMGLDQDDTIIKRRLVQKMDFLAEDLSALRDPTHEELLAWMNEHPQDFAMPPRVSFRHLYFSPDEHGAKTRDTAVEVRLKIKAHVDDSTGVQALGDPFMYQDNYSDRTPDQIGAIFGRPFVVKVFELRPGTWSDPIQSGLGWHLVFIDSMTPARVPEFEEVAEEVKSAWQAARRDEFKAEAYDVMRAKYGVILPSFESTNKPAMPASEQLQDD